MGDLTLNQKIRAAAQDELQELFPVETNGDLAIVRAAHQIKTPQDEKVQIK